MHRDSRDLLLATFIVLVSGCATTAPRDEVPSGASATNAAELPSAASPEATSPASGAPAPGGIGPAGDGPWIAYTYESGDGATSRIMVVGVDDGEPTRLINGDHNGGFCHSADGSLIGFWSDEEAPFEPFLYVANADGSARRKLSDTAGQFWCGFSRAAILVQPRTATGTILRHDLATGEETPFLERAEQLQASPDGTRYLAVLGTSGGRTLDVVDESDAARRTVHGPLTTDQSYGALTWSADGSLVSFVVESAGSGSGERSVYVASPHSSGEARILTTVDYTPRLSVSRDGRHLLVVTASATEARPVIVVDVETAEAQTIVADGVWADWHPIDTETLGVATPELLSIVALDGEAREIAHVPEEGICPDCEGDGAPPGEWGWGESWIGWSADGRHIGLPDFAPAIVVIDVQSGELQVLTGDSGGDFAFGPRWLVSPPDR